MTHEDFIQQLNAAGAKMVSEGKTEDYMDGFIYGIEFVSAMINAEAEKEQEKRREIFRERFRKLNLSEIFRGV